MIHIKRLTKREKQFCIYLLGTGNLALAAENAGYSGDHRQTGEQLICKKEIADELYRLSAFREKSLSSIAASGYQRLAFGSISDAVSLLYRDEPSKDELENMDLFSVSEIKKPKDGAMEIKFFDRLKALEKLSCKRQDDENGAKQLFDAIRNSAKAVDNSENDD